MHWYYIFRTIIIKQSLSLGYCFVHCFLFVSLSVCSKNVIKVFVNGTQNQECLKQKYN